MPGLGEGEGRAWVEDWMGEDWAGERGTEVGERVWRPLTGNAIKSLFCPVHSESPSQLPTKSSGKYLLLIIGISPLLQINCAVEQG